MTEHDQREFQAFCSKYFEEFAPRTHSEEQIVQTIAGARWRLDRARLIERNMLDGTAGTLPEDSSLTRELARVGTYEQRLHRILDRSLKLLERVQSSRHEREQEALAMAASNRETQQ